MVKFFESLTDQEFSEALGRGAGFWYPPHGYVPPLDSLEGVLVEQEGVASMRVPTEDILVIGNRAVWLKNPIPDGPCLRMMGRAFNVRLA